MDKVKDKVTKTKDGCWEWNGALNSSGYGQLVVDGKYWLAHRYTYQKRKGDLKPTELIRHKCHNTKCCNPAHLVKGDHKQNYNDSKDLHAERAKDRRKVWNIKGKTYNTIREASAATGISQDTIIKYTGKTSRKFDSEAYEKAKKIAGWK